MNIKEFKKFVLSETQKIMDTKSNVEIISESKDINILPEDIKYLVDEIKKINKKIDMRSPLITESNSNIIDSIIPDSKWKYLINYEKINEKQ